MLQLTGKNLDRGNVRLYCEDQDGRSWVILNLMTNGNPWWVPHTHSSDGEPSSPVKESVEWELVDLKDVEFNDDFYEGMSHKINTMKEMEDYCVHQYNNHSDEKLFEHYLFYEGIDNERFNRRMKQLLDLEKYLDERAKLAQDIG